MGSNNENDDNKTSGADEKRRQQEEEFKKRALAFNPREFDDGEYRQYVGKDTTGNDRRHIEAEHVNSDTSRSISLPESHPLFKWTQKVSNDGSLILSQPASPENYIQLGEIDGVAVVDMTHFSGPSHPNQLQREEVGIIRFSFNEQGDVAVGNVEGDYEGQIIFKNGDALKSVDKEGKLIDAPRELVEKIGPAAFQDRWKTRVKQQNNPGIER